MSCYIGEGVATRNAFYVGKMILYPSFSLECPLARYIWNVVSCTFDMNCQFSPLEQFVSVKLNGYMRKTRDLSSVSIVAVFSGTWKARNAACFQAKWHDELYSVTYQIFLFDSVVECFAGEAGRKGQTHLLR